MSWNTKNLLTRLFRRPARKAARRDQTNRFRPALLPLEDRTVPAGADLFANATVITGDFYSDISDNTTASGETGEESLAHVSGPANTLWWQWTATSTEQYEVNTFGSGPDTLLAVYTGSTLDSLVLVDVNDDADVDNGIFQSRVVFLNAVAGTTYRFAVDGFADQTGQIYLNLGAVPVNDNFASATAAGGTVFGSNVQATGETGEPPNGVSGENNTVWWTWTADTTGPAEINTFGSTLDTVLAVYRDLTPDTPPTFGDLELVVLNDDANDPNNGDNLDLQSQALFTAVAGTTYYVAVDGFQHQTGSITLTVPDAPGSQNNPPEIADQELSVNENSMGGAVVGTVVASDPDAGQSLTYTILGGNGAGLFSINPTTGVIQVLNSNTLNYEAQSSYQLTVQVTDNGSPTLSNSATVTIKLKDVNEKPVLNDATFSVNENSTGTVGTVTGTDVDAGHSLTYTITSGNTSGAFAINAATGRITVANAAALDFETTPTFTLVVTVTDNGTPGLTDTATVTINLNDVDDNSPTYLLGQLSNQITSLVADGSLTTSQAADLQAKLDVIKKKLEDGNTTAALNNLKAFTNQVKNLVSSGALTTAEGDSLLNAACALKRSITG